MVKFKCVSIYYLLVITIYISNIYSIPMYFATSADTTFFLCVLNLIGTIHKYHFRETVCIAVFDLGLTKQEKEELATIKKVKICSLKQTCSDMFKYFRTPAGGPLIPGWYIWKPVAIKQALDMFPYVIYIDAGISVTGSLTHLFEHICSQGYFLIDCGHKIDWMATQQVKKTFQLNSGERNENILNKIGISAGFQGLSRSVYQSYVLPMYQYAHDIALFEDDGSAPHGYGYARHDQTLFSIQAHLSDLNISTAFSTGNGFFIQASGKRIHFTLSSLIAFTRHAINIAKIRPYIKYTLKKDNLDYTGD